MPTLLKAQGFRFFFYSQEGNEPPHVHVEHGEKVAKFWLDPVQLASNHGFRSHELQRVRALIVEHHARFKENWHVHFGN